MGMAGAEYGAANSLVNGGGAGDAAKAGLSGAGGKTGSAPKAPDFTGAANAQGVQNHPNQSNPFGSSQWTQGPDGQWTQQAGLSGPLAGAAGSLQAQAAANAGTPMMTGEDARNQAITGAYNQATSRLDPQWSQREEQAKAQLQAQGLDPSSEAYQREVGNLGRERNDAYSSAMNGAIGQGTAAQQATFGENLASRMAPYAQMGALQGLGQQSQAPQGANLLAAAGLQNNAALQGYGIQQQGKNSAMGGMASMAPLLATL